MMPPPWDYGEVKHGSSLHTPYALIVISIALIVLFIWIYIESKPRRD